MLEGARICTCHCTTCDDCRLRTIVCLDLWSVVRRTRWCLMLALLLCRATHITDFGLGVVAAS